MNAHARTDDLRFYDSTAYRVILSLSLGAFLTLFLLIFQPFGVNNYDPSHRLTSEFVFVMALFGLAVAGASLVNEFLLRPLAFRTATVARIVAWSAWTCVFLSQVVFVLYNLLGDWHDLRLASALGFLVNCSAVLVFPLVGVFFWFRYNDLRQRLERVIRRANAQPRAEKTLRFDGQGSDDRLEVASPDFLYARAQDNYVELHYLDAGRPDQTLIRATLSAVADQVPPPHAVRCHRSYLVNLHAVTAVRGPKSALRLHLARVDEPIPVSRGFAGELEAHLDATA